MANTVVATGLKVQQWNAEFFKEYLAENRFSASMGTNESAVIQVREDLTKEKGDSITFALVNKLTNDATEGSATLEGNEEDLASRSYKLVVNKRRHGVVVAEVDEQFSAIGLRDAARAQLKNWALSDTETLVIRALSSINGTRYASASEANKDAWLVDNADRVLFGAARSNNSSNDHSASLANCDTTADKLTAAALSKMKTIATSIANPRIRPIRSVTSKGREYFVVYAHSYAFNDLKADTTITQAQREVGITAENERLFEGGDLYWDGMIIKEIPAASSEWNFGAVGASSAVVVGAFLCGAQALGVGYARRWRTITQMRDYEDKHGVAVDSIYGVNKLIFGSGTADTADTKDNGVVTGYFATSGVT